MEKVEPMYYLQSIKKRKGQYAFWVSSIDVLDGRLCCGNNLKRAMQFTHQEASFYCKNGYYAAFPCSIFEHLEGRLCPLVYLKELHKPIFNKNQNKF